eukprot:s384_g15.t1
MDPCTAFGFTVCDLVIQASFGVAASIAATTATTAATATTATATAAAATAMAVTTPVWLPAACVVAGVATAAAVTKMVVDFTYQPNGSQLGVGAFGEVTLHREGGKSWALKKISHAVLQHRQLQGAAETERRALEISQCSFVVQYFGYAACNHETVLVMELLHDLTKTYTSHQLWGNEQKVRLDVACIANALQHIHQQKVQALPPSLLPLPLLTSGDNGRIASSTSASASASAASGSQPVASDKAKAKFLRRVLKK